MRQGFGYFEEDRLRKTGDFRLWRRINGYVSPYWQKVVLAVLLSLIITGATLAVPYLVRIAIDRYIINQDMATAARLAGLAKLVVLFISIIIIGFLANSSQVILLEWTGQNIMHRMRQDLFGHMLALDLTFFNKNPIGKLVTRLTNDIQNMHEMFTSVIVTVFNDCIRIMGIMIILFWMNYRLALIMGLLLPIMVLNTIWFSRLARKAFRAIRTHLAGINAYLQEALSGIAVIQLFLREKATRREFEELNQNYLAKTIYQIKIFGIFMPLIDVLSALSIAMIIWYGGREIIGGRMSIGIMAAFLSYMRLFFQPLRELSQKYSIVQSAMASAERIFQLLDIHSLLPVPLSPIIPADIKGDLEFKGVSFGYEAANPIIKGIAIHISAGENLAIVGSTGSGKTTLINLLERFYDPDEGTIRLDGNDLRGLDINWLRQQIGLVMQDVFITPSSIRENILLGKEMNDQQLRRIVDDAQLAELIDDLRQGWHTVIGEGGTELSAGQKQLLAFARVLARDPRILVLDEATSSVDSETEMRIERALTTTTAHRTSIIIAHRLSTIRRADRIVVIDNGRIVEEGPHDELMARHGLYRQLQDMQNGA